MNWILSQVFKVCFKQTFGGCQIWVFHVYISWFHIQYIVSQGGVKWLTENVFNPRLNCIFSILPANRGKYSNIVSKKHFFGHVTPIHVYKSLPRCNFCGRPPRWMSESSALESVRSCCLARLQAEHFAINSSHNLSYWLMTLITDSLIRPFINQLISAPSSAVGSTNRHCCSCWVSSSRCKVGGGPQRASWTDARALSAGCGSTPTCSLGINELLAPPPGATLWRRNRFQQLASMMPLFPSAPRARGCRWKLKIKPAGRWRSVLSTRASTAPRRPACNTSSNAWYLLIFFLLPTLHNYFAPNET